MFVRFRPENRTPTRKKQSGLLSGLENNRALSPKLSSSDNSGTEDLGGLYDDWNYPEEKVEDVKVGRFKLNRATDKRFSIFTQPLQKTPSSDDDELSTFCIYENYSTCKTKQYVSIFTNVNSYATLGHR